MSVDAFIGRLTGLQGRAPKWRAYCPACGGKSRKLSIRERTDGGLLIHCFGGCDPYEVTRAIDLELSDLYPPRPDVPAVKGERRPWPAREIIEQFIGTLRVAWILLSDLANGKEPADADRVAAGAVRDRLADLIIEMQR